MSDEEAKRGLKKAMAEAVVMADNILVKRLTDLSPVKRAFLELQLKNKSLDTYGEQSIPRRATRDLASLSFGQQRLWFLNQLEPESPAYNEPKVVRLMGSLNVPALHEGLNQLVTRHEILRTTFALFDGVPAQVIAANRLIELPVVDMRAQLDAVHEAALQKLLMETIRRPFDLSGDLMLRVLLICLADQEYVLLLVTHHIASDMWSSGILWQELAALYEAFSKGKPNPLPDLSIQYADYAVWQRDWLQGQLLDTQIAYWKKQLDGLEPLQIPTDRPRPALETYEGAKQSLVIAEELSDHLKAFSRRRGVTLFTTLLAAFQTLLYRYSGQTDVAVGTPFAGRTPAETESLIGFFVNTLVMRSDLSENPTFDGLLERVREVALGAYTHHDVPFEKLVQELNPQRNLTTPFFQVMFALQNVPRSVIKLADLGVSPVDVESGIAKFDLFLAIVEQDRRLSMRVTYKTDLFDASTITRMLRHFEIILESIVADPDRRIADLPMLSEAERDQLEVQWNDTERDYPRDKCVHELFEVQVEKSPEAVAVVFEDEQVTYEELNRRANQLAHYLRKLGVGRETMVGVCMERSLEMIVGLLGILKAGGAYVPLDPQYPKDRLTFMVENTQAAVLLTKQRLMQGLAEDSRSKIEKGDSRSSIFNPQLKVIYLDKDWAEISGEPPENLYSGATGVNLAYVIYTSGSTGKPKGVEIFHRGIVRLLFGVDYAEFDASQTFLHLAPTSFDASTFEIWGALLHGAKCVLYPRAVASPRELGEMLSQHNVSTLWLTASLFNTVIDEAPEILSGVRQLLIGGEALSIQHVRRALPLLAGTRIINGYGPTESTTFTCCYRIPSELGDSLNSIPIGRPIGNTQVYILDQHLSPVPIGIPGEIYIGGDGLARRYLNSPELTAEKFVCSPFKGHPKSRLYRTGDRARFLPDGNIEFLGRIDDQVKIRGFRIEPAEIEAILGQHPGVEETMVVAREEGLGQKRLVGYVVAHQGPATTINELRSFLKQKLPEYMIPASFVFLNSFPLTPNGKVDRRALPVPDQSRPELEAIFVAPRTPVEEIIAEIWGEVFKRDRIGIHDNFFDLGGHSLLATQLVSRIRRAFQVELLPLRTVFESPTVSELADRIEEARREEQGLRTLPVLPVSREKDLPPSFAQQRLWFLDQLEPGSTVYNVPGALHMRGMLDVGALELSLNEIVRRHEALRTTFSMAEGEPVQIISPSSSLSLPVVDLTDRFETEREEEARRLTREEGRRHFDLARGPLVRATLLRLGHQDHVLLLTLHHIVSDGWSMGVLYRELSILYEAFSNGQPSPLPDLAIQYADFAIWQRKWLHGEVLESQLSYWKRQLEGIPAALDLPSDRPRPAVQSFRGARQSIELSNNLTQRLRLLSRQQGVTLFMTLLAGFQTLLYRYTGQDDIVVGSPIANRNRSEIESLIGFFVNTLVLRTNFSGNPTFRELLARVRDVALGAYAHQDLPFEKLVEELHPERNLSYSPLFQVMFALQNAPSTVWEFEGLTLHSFGVDSETAKFDLTLSMHEEVEGLRGSLEYNTDLFGPVTIEHMLSHFEVLLEGIVADPERRVSELPLLTEAEKHQLLVEWNDTERDYPKDKCIHELFEEEVERSPDAIALVFEEQQLSYGELNQRANQLAHYLKKLGVGPETLVGLCVDRSLEMIIGLLGILKAGGAYVPLDPDWPKERLAFMLADAQVTVLVTQKGLVEDRRSRIEDGESHPGAEDRESQIENRNPQSSTFSPRMQVVCLDRDWAEISREPSENVESRTTAENLAYVIYTSGSTGKPKGVLITHHNVTRLFESTRPWFQFNQNDVWTLFHSYTFDFSVWEIWGAVLHGGRLVIVPYWVSRSPELFYDLLHTNNVTVLNQTPSAFQQVVQVDQSSHRAHDLALRWIVFGGESLNVQSLKPWFDRHGDQKPRVVNMYGITETTVHVTYWPIEAQDVAKSIGNCIGKQIPDLELYILDQNQNLVPVGVPGELFVGGAGVARGYLNRPELTAERFVAHVFGRDSAARLYRTGDRARHLPDGKIEFLGRIDDQIKIRGYRIELGEIETVLAQHPGVRETVVLSREDTAGDKRLVAYVVAHQEPGPTNAELRSFLKQKLPEYMVPAAFVALKSLPLTPNGKVDRRTLPAPGRSRPESEDTFVAARTPIEELVAESWAEVLELERVGIHDNFFDLGGHSLVATQVVSRIREALQVELPVRTLFESSTIAGLAERIEEARRKEQELQMLPVSRDKNPPLSFAQQRLWFLNQLEPNSSFYNVSSRLRLTGRLDVAALLQSLNAIVQRHAVLRTTFTTLGGTPVQVISPSLNLPLPVVDLSDRSETEREEELRRLAAAEAQNLFDLAEGPLFRATLIRLGHNDHVLVLTLHHIVCDGWSMGVLYHELCVLYPAFSKGLPSPLPDLSIQYADFAVWQREWLQGEALEFQLSYWKKQLEGAPTVINLPTDRSRPAVQSYRGAEQSIELSKELTGALKMLSRKQSVTLFMTLLAAFQALLHRYTDQHDIVIGSPIANRNRTEIESLIGFFVNTLVLRSDLSGNPRFTELLARVREVALGAYAHQDLPFEKLVEEFQPERSLSHSPLFQVMFALQNAPSRDLELPGLTFDFVQIDSRTAKFDLLLSMSESAEGLKGSLEYRTDLFDSATIQRMLGHFRTLLAGIVTRPDQRISTLPILTEVERQQLERWNETEREFSRDKCIHELFEEQVEKSPAAIAVIFKDQQLSYTDLNRRANQLARYLKRLGVGPEKLVGICLERSVEMVIGLLGILKAGGAYVPLDPEYPKERLAFMLADTQATVLLTEQRWLESLPRNEARIVCLDKEWEGISRESEQNLDNEVTGENLAYASYTSGSTGKPKAVAMTHHSLCNLLSWQLQNFTCPTPARTLQFASLSFDVSFQEIFATWCSGGTLVLIPEELRRDFVGLLRCLQEQAVERLLLPFVALHQLAETAREEGVAPMSLREIITAGEQLQITRPIVSLFNKLKDCKLQNQYGPSESHVVTAFTLGGPPVTWPVLPPIGQPVANTKVYILDTYLEPVPVGVVGELYLGGDCLARGYLNRPELTAETFIANPFSSEPGACLYRTGDLARYKSDGNIEFLGRIDNQVKIRGFRIELGEIEAVLGQHPTVRETVVLAREDSPGDKRLVAYVVTSGGQVEISVLRDFLKQKLPDYMVPSAFVFLDALPLTPNGKVNRQALPAANQSRPDLENAFVAARTAVEKVLARIWGDILKLERVGIYDNFFELGGHSLLATQVMSRIHKALQVESPLRTLFETPTIAGWVMTIVQDADQLARAERRAQLFLKVNQLSDDQVEKMLNQKEIGISTTYHNMSHSPENKSDLIANRQALLDLLFQEEEQGEASAQNIPPRQSKELLPLSFAQQRLWFLDQWEHSSSTYNLTTAVRLTGVLNFAALEQSFNEIFCRHEVLRTTFATVDGQPVQVVASPKAFALPVMSLQHLPETEREAEAQRLVKDERNKPFDLIEGPLFRPTLLQLGEAEHILLLTMHHIVSDGWSMGILSRELTVLYEAFSAGHPSPLPELPIQYGDFAEWQRQWLQGEVLERQLSYWKMQLEGIPAVSNLPIDRPRPAVQGYRGKTQYLELTKELTERLKELSRKEGVTLFMTLLAAFQTLLYRYTRQEDIVVGSPIANRNRREIEGLIGFFVNTLVLRTDVSGNPSFRELLGRVRKTALDAYEHQDLPFEKLLEELQPKRSVSYSPLFQVMFILQNAPNPGLEFKRLSVNPVRLDTETAKFDLSLSIHETPPGLSGALQYNTDLFDDATITRMIGHFQILLKGIVAEPDQRISDLPMLTLAEWHQLLVEWSDTKTDYPKDKCIHELFETQVETTPDAIALIFEDRQLTYSELNTRANQLAHYLHKHGVGPDVLVGVCVERSIEMVIGLLGILKAGGGYVPLDPSYPAERLEFMLADAQVSVLLAQRNLFEDGGPRIDDGNGQSSILDRRIQRICLDRDWELIARESDLNPENITTADNLAYVIYTSGSTGQSKGVTIEHRNTVGFLSWVHATFTPEELSGVLAATSICFDLSVFEIFAPLTSGGMVILAENPLALATIPNRARVSLLNTVPSALNELLRLGAIPASVRVINLAGEPLRPELVRRIYESTSVHKVHDLYGPSECTTYSTWAYRSAEGPQIIGRPIANTQVYILDAYLNPAPIGVVGEIYIGGDGVARGYLNQPKLTAERFTYHSFDGEPAQRLYRTGDLARYLPDGNIEFLGRTDNQVKIRGYRIELGEIEAVLTQHPAVRESAVITREDRAGDKQLVAYMVSKESAPAASELRTFLKAKLPEYMVPSAFVVLDSLPLTPNGKVDRQALPEPDRGSADLEQVYVAPRNASEQAIADIWVEILGVKRIGVHDNFFDRGGHSLKATQIVSRLRKMFGSEIPLRYMFQFPTIAELAAVIDSTTKTQSNDEKLDGLLTEIEAMTEIEAQRLVDKDIGSKVSD